MELDFTPQLLIVDDCAKNLDLLKALLGELNVNLDLVQSPINDIQYIEKKEYALVILDLQLPQKDGFLLAQKIRSGKLNKLCPIIFSTASFFDATSESKGYNCGWVDFVMKPFDAKILLNKVTVFLDLYCSRKLIEAKNEKLQVALSEKELIEGHLRNLASSYRSILEAQSELIVKINSSYKIEFANKTLTNFFDYPLSGIAQDHVASVSPILLNQLKQGVEKLNGRENSIKIEGQISNPKGQIIYLEWIICKELEFGDTYYLAIGRDVTEKKQIKDSLIKKEDLSRKLQKRAQIGSFEWDSYSKLIRGSDEFLRLYEIKSSQIDNVFEEIKLKTHPDDREAIERLLLNLPKKNQKLEFEHRYTYSNGEMKYFKLEIYSEYNLECKVFNLYGLASDISKEKDMEFTFKESLSLEHDVYKEKAIFELNSKNQISYVNDYACDFLECQDLRNEKNVDFVKFFRKDEKIKVEKLLNLIGLSKGFAFELVSIETKKKTLKRIVLAAHSCIVNNENGVRGILMEIVDNKELEKESTNYKDIITGFKRQEKEFANKTKKLKEKVEKELKVNDFHRQLLLKKSELESLGKMASSMVNEINQPLAGISMIMDNLLLRLSMKKIDEEYIREKCSQVFADIDRIKKCLSQVGIYNSSQKEDVQEVINVKSLVNETINLIKKQHRRRSVEISFKTNNNDLYVRGNKYKLQKVMMDILNNAYESIDYKYTHSDGEEKSAWIKITTDLVKENIVIVVKDNGIGIDTENLNYVFEPFFTTKQSGIGSGLGLYISKGIVQRMNGQIAVQSTKNEFTEMKLVFPCEKQISAKTLKLENH
ncbi:ATP-binding protein [Labilibaculum sp.]|uniref:ATP-binding protein n=1 Tax=Labilibaculum sp. TaxID=2060723 RepID=UPI003563B55D